MITYREGTYRFNYRVAGLVIHNNRALLHRLEADEFWALPGGRVELMENSQDAVLREIKEEAGVNAELIRLLWIVENFFASDELKNHEICFYYHLMFPDTTPLLQLAEFDGIENGIQIIFKWFDLSELQNTVLYPTFLKTKICNLLPEIEHIVHVDEE